MDDIMRLEAAAIEFVLRQSRQRHPKGSFDKQGRWWPDEEEERPCCRRIRTPSRRWPYSLLVHCRTLHHIAQLFGVDENALRKVVKQVKAMEVLAR